jgi:cytochrome P450
MLWRWPFAGLERCRSRYGSRFTLHATGYPPLVFLSDLEDIKTLLNAPADVLHPGTGGGTIMPIVGANSFMLLDEDEHLAGRRVILPFFQSKAVQRHADEIADVVQREVASWPRGTPVALHPRLRTLTLDLVLRTALGRLGVLDESELHALRDRLLAMLSVTASVVFPQPRLRHGPGRSVWKSFLRARAEVDELIFSIIDDGRRREGVQDDMLASLLAERDAEGRPLSRRAVRDNIMSIVLAGHETTASELAWAFQLLAHNPAVLERLVAEIDEGAGEEYMTATIHEVLRHRPVFLFAIPRAVKQPIDIGAWSFQPPTHLLACIYLVHHDPTLYPQPHEFRPERFLETVPRAPVWLPWGGGRKRCPGRHAAVLEMKTVLRTVLSSVTVSPASRYIERPRWRSVIVTPHAGARVVLRSR